MTGIGRSGIALPLSLRTPKTQELSTLQGVDQMTALLLAVALMADEPLVPVVSTPVKLMPVIDR